GDVGVDGALRQGRKRADQFLQVLAGGLGAFFADAEHHEGHLGLVNRRQDEEADEGGRQDRQGGDPDDQPAPLEDDRQKIAEVDLIQGLLGSAQRTLGSHSRPPPNADTTILDPYLRSYLRCQKPCKEIRRWKRLRASSPSPCRRASAPAVSPAR